MRTLLLFILFPFYAFNQLCDPNGNIVLYSNYDGGELVINVDEDIPNLKIGVVSYEAVRVVFTGTYTSNVTGIVIAGYAGTNDPCNLGLTGNSIVNYPGGSLLMTTLPSATLTNSNGNANIICAYSCDINSNQGGCNTVDQIEDYMLTQFTGGSIRSHTVQYACWSSDQLVSEGGNCCLTTATNPITISLAGTNPICFDSCNGDIISTVSGGDGTYTYSWTGSSETTANLSDLCAGEYTLTVTDGDGAQESETIVLIAPTEINLNVSIVTPVICNGDNATVQITASDGVEPYSGDGAQSLPAGTHTITVEDGNGCSVSEEITITEPDELVVSSSTTEAISGCIGSITLTVSGGDGPYDVLWDVNTNNQTGETATDLCAGIYCGTVTDDNGCEITICDTVSGHVSLSEYGLNEKNNLILYPNPSGKTTNLRINSSFSEDAAVEVIDAQGRLFSTETVSLNEGLNEVILEVNEKGNYLIRVSNERFSQIRKWIVTE